MGQFLHYKYLHTYHFEAQNVLFFFHKESPTKGFLGFLGAKEGLYRFTVIEKETDIAKSFVKNILKNSPV